MSAQERSCIFTVMVRRSSAARAQCKHVPGALAHDDPVKGELVVPRGNELWLVDTPLPASGPSEHPNRDGKLYLCGLGHLHRSRCWLQH